MHSTLVQYSRYSYESTQKKSNGNRLEIRVEADTAEHGTAHNTGRLSTRCRSMNGNGRGLCTSPFSFFFFFLWNPLALPAVGVWTWCALLVLTGVFWNPRLCHTLQSALQESVGRKTSSTKGESECMYCIPSVKHHSSVPPRHASRGVLRPIHRAERRARYQCHQALETWICFILFLFSLCPVFFCFAFCCRSVQHSVWPICSRLHMTCATKACTAVLSSVEINSVPIFRNVGMEEARGS